ncbi:MAG: hypothetical protein ACMG55_19575, partial [Microcoleus sp.]
SVLFASRDQRAEKGFTPLPVKELSYNRCPAVAPLGVLDEAAQKRLGLDLKIIQKHLAKLIAIGDFGDRVREAYELREAYDPTSDVDGQLYDGFINNKDKQKLATVRASGDNELADFNPNFIDERLPKLLLRYKARNYPRSLSQDERLAWEVYRAHRIQTDMAGFVRDLKRIELSEIPKQKEFLLSELRLWAESIVPIDVVEEA